MKTVTSLKDRIIALALCVFMVLTMIPANVIAVESTAEAKIGDIPYDTLAEAIAAVPTGTDQVAPAEATTITLLRDVKHAFDVGNSTGSTTMNLKLDLGGNTLTLAPSVGSAGTKANGIRVLAYSKLEIANGTVICSSEAADNVKVGIANYSELVLDNVTLEKGSLTQYTINNRGALTLKGKSSVSSGSVCAVTNDPYNLYYTTDVDASITCDSSEVVIESILVERYARNSANKGGVKLNISAGYVGSIKEDENSSVPATYNLTGGSFGSDVSQFCSDNYQAVEDENGNFVVKSKQTAFAFEQEVYTVTFGADGNKFTPKVENAAGEVTYSLVTGADVADLNTDNGELTIKKAGTVQVKAVSAGNAQYLEAEATCTVVVEPAYAEVYSFSGGTVTGSGTADTVVSFDQVVLEWVEKDESIGRTQDGWWVGIKIVAPAGVDLSKAVYQRRSGGTFDGAAVTPFVPEEDRYMGMWGLITAEYLNQFSNDGKKMNYVWRFSWDGDDVYEQTIAMTIDPNGVVLKQSGFAFAIDEDTITYGDSYTIKEPTGGQANNITYSVENVSESDTAIATINPETNALIVNKAGVVKITATLSGKFYENITDSYLLTILKAPQPDFGFDNPATDIIWTKDVLDSYALKGCLGTGKVTWTITAGNDVASVDPQTGKITLHKAGQFTLQAQNSGDDCYLDSAAAEITVNVGLARNTVALTNGNAVSVTYGTTQYKNALKDNLSTGAITYTISGDDIGASVDTDGNVNFADSDSKVGTITVTAEIAADEQYDAATVSYTLTVGYLAAPEEALKLQGDKKNTTAWYTNTVSILAPNGYTISKDNELSTADWDHSVPYDREGENGTETVYLRDGNGYMTGPITVANISLDKNAPTELKIAYAQPKWAVMLESITFGLFQSAELEVTISAKDAISGVAALTYNFDGTEITVNNTGADKAEFSYSFTIDAQYRNKITLKAVDVAGNESELLEDGITVVLDTENPTLDVQYQYATGDFRNENGIFYTQGDATVVFTLDEANFDLSGLEKLNSNGDKTGVPVLVLDNAEQTVTWTKIENTTKWTTSLLIQDDGDHVVSMTFTDPAGNSMEDFRQEIRIDKTAPELSVTFDNNAAKNGNNYNADRNATITIKEHNFHAADVAVSVTAKNILGQDVTVQDYASYAKDIANWTSNGDVHTLVLPFTVDAIYDVHVDYADLSGIAANGYQTNFVVDHLDATDVEITYSRSVKEMMLSLISFGIYKAKADVIITAKDMTSGVDYFVLTYTKGDDASSINKDTFTTEPIAAVPSGEDASVFTATYTLDAQADGTFSVELFDKAGNDSRATDGKRIVADNKHPVVKPEYEFASGKHHYENNIYYTQNDVTVKFFIDEANFRFADAPVIKVNGKDIDNVQWNKTNTEDEWVGQIVLSGDGDYKVSMTFVDASTNEMAAFFQEIHIDSKAPDIDVSYNNDTALNGNCYKNDRTATITVTEHNFKAENVDLTVTAKDIFGNDVAVMDYLAYAKDINNWNEVAEDVYELEVPFTTDAIYTVTVDCEDLAGNASTDNQPVFVVDHTPAENIQITYTKPVISKIIETLSFGFYQAKVVVTVTAEDMTSGVDYFELTYTRDEDASDAHTADFMQKLVAQPGENAKTFTASYTVPAEARGSYSVKVFDRAGNDSNANDKGTVIVTDTIGSNVSVQYTELEYKDGFRDAAGNVVKAADAAQFYYSKAITATITVDEANFFEGKKAGANNEEIVHEFVIKVTKTDNDGNVTVTEYLCAGAKQLVDGAKKETITWTSNGDTHTTSITFAEDGDYVLELAYQDFSGNESGIDGSDGNNGGNKYTSRTFTVDNTNPVINVTYDNNSALNEKCYKDDRTATITVTEHNFNAKEFDVTVTAKNLVGDVQIADYAAFAKDPENWDHNGNVHTLKLLFAKDATYTLDVAYTDMAGRAAADFAEQTFVVDHTDAANIQIAYSTPVFKKIIEGLSFGFYKADVLVTVTAEDLTSGVDYFELTYTRDEDASDAHTDDFMQKLMAKPGADAKTFTASYTVPAESRGQYSVKVYDRAGNDSYEADQASMIVADTVSPAIKVTYTTKNTDTKVHFVDKDRKDVATFAEAYNAFYNGDVVATITVDEANFFEGKKAGTNNEEIVHEVVIKVTKTDDNGKETVTEYLSAGAKQLVEGAQKETIAWTANGDTYTTAITFADDGDYVLEITYADYSQNESVLSGNDGVAANKTYTSKIITVDETAPVVAVAYGNTDVINTIDGRNYFDKVQSAVITVTEHNFRAADVAAVVTAKNVVDADIAVADFAAQLADEKNWKHEGNVHTAEVNYTVDANYTFDIDMIDLAQNASADYTTDLFTVDTTAPKNLSVTYSTNVFQEILESVTFGYYNAMMTVTITAEDDVTGIYHFAYSYLKGQYVSGVNAELLDQAIREAAITYNGNKATATFSIPKLALGRDNQFNGTVQFTAYDRSENKTELKDTTRIVVDNISPTATITYNTPVKEANGISYYAGDIDATIVINEANFNARDVVVTVTKDGQNYPVNVAWYNNSVDTHTGTFTLTEDGDYFVSVQYRDKSGNQMAAYTSNELTLDTQAPAIKVSNIKQNSANKDAKYGFTIEISDIKLDVASVKPVLKAVMQTADGQYKTTIIDLGKATAVVENQTYTYTVENLEADALYALTCEAEDMSDNANAKMLLDDGKSYELVQFSINRNGSVFGYGNSFVEELVNQYYVYSVEEDIVVVEVNVDPIEDYAVTVNGKELTEGTDYTTEQTSNNGEWSKRTYTISKALFATEGEYNVIVSSTDKTETTAYSDVKNLVLRFVVDQTKPVLTISGLQTGGRYQTELQKVTIIPTDEGGRLNSLSVVVLNADGNPLADASGNNISNLFSKEGEELLKYLEANDGMIVVEIPEGLNNQVRIICNDCVANSNEYDELFENVTVSPNQLVIFYANKPLFFGTIGGTAAVGAAVVGLIKVKKGKRVKAKV